MIFVTDSKASYKVFGVKPDPSVDYVLVGHREALRHQSIENRSNYLDSLGKVIFFDDSNIGEP